MGIYVNGIDMPKQNEILQIRIYGDGKVSRVYNIECQQIGTATQTTQVVPIEDVWRGVQPLKDKILELEEKLYLQKDRQNGEWIPVSERSPKVGEICLLTVHEYGWNCEEYTRVIIGEYSDNYADHILAWMPLPTPYKGGDDE